mmetsp:Transcript_8566/g.14428  ORF Transcript_8566/g.14428 Transcript_8566/m.14428 type:complete len:205 (-) Transcript_8566:1669-2283(-)
MPRGTRGRFLPFLRLRREVNRSVTWLARLSGSSSSVGKSTKSSSGVSPEWPEIEYSKSSASSALLVPLSSPTSSTPSSEDETGPRRGKASIINNEASSMRSSRRSMPLKRIILPETSTTNWIFFFGTGPSSEFVLVKSAAALSEYPRRLNTSRSPDRPSTSLESSRLPCDWLRSHTRSLPRLVMSFRISFNCATCKEILLRYCW